MRLHTGSGNSGPGLPSPTTQGCPVPALPGVSQGLRHVTPVFVPRPEPVPAATGWGKVSKTSPS